MSKGFLSESGVKGGIIDPAKDRFAELKEQAENALGGNNITYDAETEILSLKKGEEVLSETKIERPQYGIKLGNVTDQMFKNLDEGCGIWWTDPSDVVVDGQTLAKFKATLVIRKVGSAPTSRYDGTIVYDGTGGVVYDKGLVNGTTYYYGFFPHSTDDVYNYDSENVKTFVPSEIIPTLEGYDPSVGFTAVKAGDGSVTVTWSGKDYKTSNAEVVGIEVSERNGTVTSEFTWYQDYLTSGTITGIPNDVEQRVTITLENTSAAGNHRHNTTPYYSVYFTPSSVKIWGYHHDFTKLNPDEAITYLSGTINENYAPMMTNSGNGTVTAGSWGSFLTDVLKNKPYSVRSSSAGVKAIDPNDYTKFADGSSFWYKDVPGSLMDDDYHNAFAWLNKLYMKEVYAADGNSRDVYFSDEKVDDSYYPIGFINPKGEELEGVFLPMGYLGESEYCVSMIASGNKSVIGTNQTTAEQQGIINKWQENFPTNKDFRCVFLGGPIVNFLRDLEYMLYKNTDIQKTAGYGLSDKGSVSQNSLVSNGPVVGFYGTGNATDSASRQTANKMFHSQVLGSYNQYLRDPYTITDGGVLKVSSRYKNGLSGDTIGDASVYTTISGWVKTTGVTCYPKSTERINDEYGSLPANVADASNSTGLCDYNYVNSSGVRAALRLGGYNYGLNAGPAYVFLSGTPSGAGSYIGAALLLLPPAGYTPPA